MREMKDSGIEWVGAIPAAWGVHRIASHFQEIKEKNTANAYSNALQFKMGKIIAKPQKWDEDETNETYSAYTVVHPNTIMINGLNLEFDFVTQRVARVECNGIITSAYIALSPRDNINAEYICYLLKSYDACRAFHSMGRGLRKILSYSELKNKPIVVPPLAEQERIAAFLDAECAEIDTVLEKTRASIEEYKKLKQAVITQAVTKGIRGDRPMKNSGIEWIGEIPKEFETLQLKFLCKLITDGTHFSPSTVETGLPYITAGDVHGIGLDYNSAKRISEEDFNLLVNQGCQPLKGDVLLVKDGATTGRVGFVDSDVPCVILSSVAMLRPADNINGHYLMYLLASYFLQNQILVSMAGSAMPRITLTKLVKYIGLLSPLSEQQEIADYLDEKCAGIDALITKKQQYLTEIENYKKSLIYEYVTGKKEVV